MIWQEKYLNPLTVTSGYPSPSILYVTNNNKLGTLKE